MTHLLLVRHGETRIASHNICLCNCCKLHKSQRIVSMFCKTRLSFLPLVKK